HPAEERAAHVAAKDLEATLCVSHVQLEHQIDDPDVCPSDQITLVDVRKVARMQREQRLRVAARSNCQVRAGLEGVNKVLHTVDRVHQIGVRIHDPAASAGQYAASNR